MKQADIAKELGSLINQTNGAYTTIQPTEIPSEIEEPSPLFEVDYDDEQEQSRQKALVTVKYIVSSVIPQEYQDTDMITNKMQLDAEQLGMLYYQQKMNNITIKNAMNQLASGDTQVRLYEVIDKLQKRASDLSQQITETQNQFRKYYIDSYLDLEEKLKAEAAKEERMYQLEQKQQRLANNEPEQTKNGGYKFGSPKDTLRRLQMEVKERKKKQNDDEIASFEEMM